MTATTLKPRNGDWIETYTGGMVWPLDPRPEEIRLRDIAHGLSLMCRFNGQCKYFYSVAQHSLNVQKEIERLTVSWDYKDSIVSQLAGLLHDSSECLGISDICSPAKKFMPEYRRIEEKIQNAVWEAFGLKYNGLTQQIVNHVDKAIVAYEAKILMNCLNWDINYSYMVHMNENELSHIDLSLRDMEEVEQDFLHVADRLLSRLNMY